MLKTTFTLLEAAELLSCHTETLRRAIKNGDLCAAQLGREYRISRSDLQAFWSAKGGWDLFGDGENGAPPAPPPRGSMKKPKTYDGPQQLNLFGSEEEK